MIYYFCVLFVGDGTKRRPRTKDWKGVRKKAVDVKSSKPYVTYDEICYTRTDIMNKPLENYSNYGIVLSNIFTELSEKS
jgi:hypothetical protein